AGTNRCLVERGRLSRLPLDDQIGAADGALAPQQRQRPRFVTPGRSFDGHDALHWFDALGKRSIIEERLLTGRFVAGIWITSVIACARIVRDKYLALREALPEASK